MNKFLICTLSLPAFLACSGTDRRGDEVQGRDDGPRVVERTIARPADTVCAAALSVARDLSLTLDDDRHDRMGGDLIARRANGDRLTIEVRGLDDHQSRVVVRVDPNNGDLANIFHAKLLHELGMDSAKSALLGGNTAEGSYACDLGRGAAAAEEVLRVMGFERTRKDLRETKAVVDGRRPDSVPVRISLFREDAEKTKVRFIVGASSTPGAGTTAQKMKLEFERRMAAQEQ